MKANTDNFDVVVVGGGNAALCAALSAREEGARVLLLERAPVPDRGGNSSYTEGLMRFVYNGVDDLRALAPDLTDDEIAGSDFGAYTEEQFFDDMARVTQNRTDPDLCEILVKNSNSAMHWLRKQGVRFMPQFGRQAFNIDGKFKFWGGATMAAWGAGPGLVSVLYKAAEQRGIEIVYGAWVRELIHTDAGVSGVVAKVNGITCNYSSRAVVLACGGFEANTEWRSRYLGPGWDLVKVRGTKYNTGDGLAMALDIGAQPRGHWSGCHAIGWERYAPDFGDLSVTDDLERSSYQFSVFVNADGKRFVDEGADFRNYTYAKYGGIVLEQPGRFAWEIYDSKVLPLLRSEYRTKHVTKVRADSIQELAVKMEDVNGEELLKTIKEFNAAVQTEVPFNPNVKDGKSARGLAIPKSNWANAIDTPPFEAYAVTCGITFTFGGVRITNEAQVVNTNHEPIGGLFAAGEMVGGLFYFNYPGSTGLTSGTVFGRIAGRSAARAANAKGAEQ
jgi:tricarballylate dehydrogenase